MEQQPSTGSKRAWYKHWWGVIVAVLFFPFFILWWLWAKSSWHIVPKVIVSFIAGFFAIAYVSAAANPSSLKTQPPAKPPAQQAPASPQYTYKNDAKTEPIPFTTEQATDPVLPKGQQSTKPGTNGVKTITYKVKYQDNKEVSRDKVSEEVTTQPIAEVVTTGTYVAPSSPPPPAQNSTVRTGAICKDGWQSSATGSGACSHHGGVSYWTY